MRNFAKLVISIAIAELAGVMGSLFTIPAIPTWYATLAKPALSPPNWVFGPVWTTLYALMGIAAFLVWREGLDRRDVRRALIIFDVQLILNVLWSFLFFGLHNPIAALVEIVVLWCAILVTIIVSHRVSRPAAYLLIPYLANKYYIRVLPKDRPQAPGKCEPYV